MAHRHGTSPSTASASSVHSSFFTSTFHSRTNYVKVRIVQELIAFCKVARAIAVSRSIFVSTGVSNKCCLTMRPDTCGTDRKLSSLISHLFPFWSHSSPLSQRGRNCGRPGRIHAILPRGFSNPSRSCATGSALVSFIFFCISNLRFSCCFFYPISPTLGTKPFSRMLACLFLNATAARLVLRDGRASQSGFGAPEDQKVQASWLHRPVGST